jgi:sulfate transport system substrate-binding protein
VAVVDKVVLRRGTRTVAEEYLKYLYTPEGQEIAARNFYRPTLDTVARKYDKQFARVTLFELKDYFIDWATAQKTHFADGGSFDVIYKAQ